MCDDKGHYTLLVLCHNLVIDNLVFTNFDNAAMLAIVCCSGVTTHDTVMAQQ